MRIDYNEAAEFLRGCDNVLILAHASPDGDTIGSSFGLCRSLRLAGKKADVSCSDEIPPRYDYLNDWYSPEVSEPQTIIACDVADANLLGEKNRELYGGKIDLCIDHHISNSEYAERLLLGDNASACEVVYTLLRKAELPIDNIAAMCLYTGMATDTGCFKFENVTKTTHLLAAELYDYDIPFARINRELFDIKSRARLKIEQIVMSNLEMYFDGKCAVASVTLDMAEKEGVAPGEFEGIATLPMQIEGVCVGITLREKEPGLFKISVRTADDVNASDICANFGGGGHIRAAGCKLKGTLKDAEEKMLKAAAEALGYGGEV